jgi:histidyl-tRNA synthetase
MKYNLTTQPYKGTRDYYPKDMFKRNYIFNIWRETALEFGYEEYDNPVLEDANLYRAKSGDELANTQLYNFTDKGGREVAIKPEMTPSLARMIAGKINELPKPIRWFNISKYYRYEKPQRGRSREFFQLNLDILGEQSTNAEIEVFMYINAVMNKFKAPSDSWMIMINNRKLVDYILNEQLKLDESLKPAVSKAIDNYTKIQRSEYPKYLKDTGLTDTQVEKLISFLNSDLEALRSIDNEGATEILNILSMCEKLGITNVQFKPYIMRGLAYYTGTVMELFDIGSGDNPRALFGGGRYDDLLNIFDKDSLPAFGLGWGNVTMEDYLDTYKLFPDYKPQTQVFVTLLDEKYLESNQVSTQLREKGICVEQQLKPSKLGKQLEYANKKGIPYVLIIEENSYSLKNLEIGVQEVLSIDEIIQRVSRK